MRGEGEVHVIVPGEDCAGEEIGIGRVKRVVILSGIWLRRLKIGGDER